MSRRPPPNPAELKRAQNLSTLKSLLKLDSNKICADCKINKHPRWASWNLGIFVCIRCSGIHRGMGTHISRVKSVDLDSWTDEQVQSMLNWGNARARKYWEAKLAPTHVPSEAKIENFIRTKYELKRWVMDGPMPDPSTLDTEEAEDDIPLSIVKERKTVDASLRRPEPPKAAVDLIGGDDPVPARSSSAGPIGSQVTPKANVAPPKVTTAPKDSLFGDDFFAAPSAAPPRPSSTNAAGALGGQSRPDLKQSILSLYASVPKQPAQQQATQATTLGSFSAQPQQSSSSGLDDAFGSLTFSTAPSQQQQQQQPPSQDPFASFGSTTSNNSKPVATQPSTDMFAGLSGGSFFSAKPATVSSPPGTSTHSKQPSTSSFGGFGDFTAPSPVTTEPAVPSSAMASLGDMFGFSSTPSQPATITSAAPTLSPTVPSSSSVFNLSTPKSPPATSAVNNTTTTIGASAGWGGSDPWGSNAWAAPDNNKPVASAAPSTQSPPITKTTSSGFGGGWGDLSPSFASQSVVPSASGGLTTTSLAPKVAEDEEFGGWTSSTGNTGAKPAGGLGGDDLFTNVWE